MEKPQMILHQYTQLNYTAYDCKWIPSSPKFIVLGGLARGTGCLDIFEVTAADVTHVKQIEKSKPFKCGTFGASSLQQRHFATGDFDGRMCIWNLEKPEIPIYHVKGHKEIINSIDGVGGLNIGEGAPEIVTGSRDGLVKLWDSRQPVEPVAVMAPSKPEGNAYTPEERCVAAGYDNGDVKLFDLRAMTVRWETNLKNGVCHLEFDRKDICMNKLVATTLEQKCHVFDLRTLNEKSSYATTSLKAHDSTIWACRHLPQNRDVFVTCGGEGSIHLWKYNYPANRVQEDSEKKPVGVIGNVELIQDVRLGGQPINAFDWSPDTQGLAVATGFDQSCFLLGSLCHAALPADDSLCMDITDRLLNGGGKLVDDLVDYKATRRRHPLLYLQRKVTPPRQVSGNPIAFCWHPGQPLFAICTYNEQLTSGAVSFFDGDGGFEQKFPARNRPSCPDCVTWHPNPSKRLLVVSWRDAKITVYDLDKNAAQEGSPTELPITRFIWHAEEPFPLTAIDRANHLILWKTGAVNISKPTSVHDASQAVVCLAFLGQRIEATQSRKLDGISPMTGGQTDFLIGCQGGGVFHLNMDGNLVEVRQLNEPVVSLTYWHTSGIPIRNAYVVTETLRVIRYQATNSNVFEEKLSVVLIGKTPASSLCWIDADTLAVASVENILRVWDIPRLQHSDLSVQEFTGTEDSEVIRTISVNKRTGVVMGATNTGNVLFWSLLPRTSSNTDKSQTIACPISSAKRHAEVMTIQSSVAGTDFLAASQKEVFLFQARSLVSATAYPVVAIQVSANVFSVMHEAPGAAAFYKTRFTIVGLAASEKTVAVWGEDQATIYDLTLTNQLKESATFHRDFIALGLYGANLVAAKSSSLSLLSRQGVAGKLDLRIPPNEGSTALFDIHGRFCVIATTSGHMKLADLDRIDRKQWTKSKSVKDTTSLFAKFIDVKLNFNGSFVAFLIDENVPTPKCAKIYTWDTERDTVLFYDCLLEKDALMSRDKTFSRAWLPVRLIWDCNDSRLLCVSFTAPDTSARQDSFSSNMATFFPSSEKGLLLNAVMNLADGGPGLFLCCAAPWVLLYAGSTEKGGKLAVIKRLLPDFSGFLSDNPDDLKTIINFCYFSALDKIAEAVNTVKTSNTALVWNHLAKLCVRRGKLEYSKMCLSRLGRADILANLRHFALNNPQPEVQLGHLAALLQLKEVAETHFSASKSPELSVELQQAAGDWTGVLEKPPSTTADRLSRRQTLYALAKDDMTFGDFQQAIEKFTEANCEKFDVPRLLLKKRPADLRAYIEKSTDRKLLEWYGRFLEMQGEIEEAVEYYSKAGDLKSVVRTMSDDVDEALALVRSSKDKAAAFQLAHTLEVDDDTEPQILIELFEIASAYSNAIRVCMDHGLDDKLVQLALKSEKPEMLGAAKYLEGKGLADKAITLFHRAGQLTKATDLAFEQGYYGNIETISEDIDENSDPVLLDRCVAYFSEHNQIDRAVNLLIRAKKLYAAVKLCIQHQMTIDKRLVSLVLEQKSTGAVNIAERTSVIQQLADRCSAQGLYHEAARLLIDIKQPEAAMYALVKTGDIDAILRYIRIIRDPDALIVAGNNLQAHPWHQKKEIFDAIVLAYKRAGAQLYLASFYDSWGETACESGRYDVATEAFGKSYDILAEVLSSKETAKDMETAKEEMDTKRKVVSYFLEVQRESQTSPEAAIPLSEELVKHCKWDSGVRAGHVFALLISVSITIGAIPKAKAYLRKLRTECPTSHTLTDYVDETVLQQLQ